MEAQHEAIAEVTNKGNLRKAFRQAKKDPWVFKGSLDDVGEAGVPQVLQNMIFWMPKGECTVKKEEPLGDLGIILHIYLSDTDVLVLALCRIPELNAESVILS